MTPKRFLLRLALPLALPFAFACHSVGPRDVSGPIEAEIHRILERQVAYWNEGDLEGFMRVGYWQSEDLTFLSGGDWNRGYEPVLLRYRQRYQGEGQEMGTLSFSDLEVRVLGKYAAMARGRWNLDFEEAESAGGLFTLVFELRMEGWRISHDHTSSNSNAE